MIFAKFKTKNRSKNIVLRFTLVFFLITNNNLKWFSFKKQKQRFFAFLFYGLKEKRANQICIQVFFKNLAR